jgi:excisionase family DNA binding protein
MNTPCDLTIRELSQITRRHVETLRRLARENTLPGAYRIGGRWMFRAEALDALRSPDNDEKRGAE